MLSQPSLKLRSGDSYFAWFGHPTRTFGYRDRTFAYVASWPSHYGSYTFLAEYLVFSSRKLYVDECDTLMGIAFLSPQ